MDDTTGKIESVPNSLDPTFNSEANVSLAALPPKVLKHGDTFAVLDPEGDCGKSGSPAEGVYFRDTRYLSRWRLTVNDHRPLLLASNFDDESARLVVNLTNPDMDDEGDPLRKDTIAVGRTTFLTEGACFERIEIRNFDVKPRSLSLELHYAADFMDLFEVRGLRRGSRGEASRKVEDISSARFDYRGLDGIERATRIRFQPTPQSITISKAIFRIDLEPGGRTVVFATLQFWQSSDTVAPRPQHFLSAYRSKMRDTRALASDAVHIETSHSTLTNSIRRSRSDIYMLLSKTAYGGYPYAGIPWYSTVFGRDGLITALLMLWADPSIARGVLLYLAACQATTCDPFRDAQPGKIVHEQRRCETANTGEVPFASYYGSVDATPLFVVLAGRYFTRTADVETIKSIWPSIVAALAWCDTFGDPDGDGFLEYVREKPTGLANQGWKDSFDAIFHRDGALADGPIALVEVQGYAYDARLQAAMIADHLGETALAATWRAKAAKLKAQFDDAFWCADLQTYALALDGRKNQCQVKASNPGHILMADLAPAERVDPIVRSLMSSELFCGWGIRTLATDAPRYNPMSYHNGSVWPHDNAIIGIGMALCGHRFALERIFEAISGAQSYQAEKRLPELFCGFPRKLRRGPVSYPVSCAPQAWSSAASFGLWGALLGLSIDGRSNTLTFSSPRLPRSVDHLTLRHLNVGSGHLDVRLYREDGNIRVDVLTPDENVRLSVLD